MGVGARRRHHRRHRWRHQAAAASDGGAHHRLRPAVCLGVGLQDSARNPFCWAPRPLGWSRQRTFSHFAEHSGSTRPGMKGSTLITRYTTAHGVRLRKCSVPVSSRPVRVIAVNNKGKASSSGLRCCRCRSCSSRSAYLADSRRRTCRGPRTELPLDLRCCWGGGEQSCRSALQFKFV